MKYQDRKRWSRPLMAEGFHYLDLSASGDELTEMHLEAGIAGTHCLADSYEHTDWDAIVNLYDQLTTLKSSIVAHRATVSSPQARSLPAQVMRVGHAHTSEDDAEFSFAGSLRRPRYAARVFEVPARTSPGIEKSSPAPSRRSRRVHQCCRPNTPVNAPLSGDTSTPTNLPIG